MATIQREFYRSARGPVPADEDWWCLVFAPETHRLFVRRRPRGIVALTSSRSANFWNKKVRRVMR